MAVDYAFSDEDKEIDEGLGFPRAYAKICRDHCAQLYSNGPPFTFIPYTLQQNEVNEVTLISFSTISREIYSNYRKKVLDKEEIFPGDSENKLISFSTGFIILVVTRSGYADIES